MNNWAEFRHFKYVLAIIEHMGLRAAAEHLRTAEPNLSVQAKQFQENLAIQLFRRAKDGRIQLTKTGVAFKPIAQGLLDAREEAIAALIAIERGQICTLTVSSVGRLSSTAIGSDRKSGRRHIKACAENSGGMNAGIQLPAHALRSAFHALVAAEAVAGCLRVFMAEGGGDCQAWLGTLLRPFPRPRETSAYFAASSKCRYDRPAKTLHSAQ